MCRGIVLGAGALTEGGCYRFLGIIDENIWRKQTSELM
jgi:hypothetical protein